LPEGRGMFSLAGQCILVLEDDAANATKLVHAIEGAGGDTIYAANAFEALQRLDQFDINAAVIDYLDGGADRTAVVARLRFEGIPFASTRPPPRRLNGRCQWHCGLIGWYHC
jgi:CheY-like chemotaxis protein